MTMAAPAGEVTVAALLAAFAAGATLLQACPRLPPAPGTLVMVAVCLMGAALFVEADAQGDRGGGSQPNLALIAAVVAGAAVVAAGLSGFSYAAWRAHVRLADELPPAWEERDVRVTGIVDDLPHEAPGTVRFALAVERIDTAGAIVPQRISLAWFAQRATRRRAAIGHSHRSCMRANAGR